MAIMSKIEIVISLLDNIPENLLPDVIDFLLFLKLKNDKAVIQDIEAASMSSTDFWDNPDDEVWNHV